MAAPAGRIAIRYVPDDPAWLAIAIVDTTADVDAGTVYRVVRVVAAGFDCPRTLYAVGMRLLKRISRTRLTGT
jgi:hypothetical protein